MTYIYKHNGKLIASDELLEPDTTYQFIGTLERDLLEDLKELEFHLRQKAIK